MSRPSLRERVKSLSSVDVAGAAIAGGMVLIFVVGVIGPVALREQRAAAAREQTIRQQQRVRATSAAVKKLTIEVEQAKAQIATSPVRVLPPSALNGRLAELVRQAGECGLMVSDLKPGAAVPGSRFVAIPVSITGRGGYPAVTAFLRAVHEHFPDVGVCAFRLDGDAQKAESQGVFKIDIHWLAQPASPTRLATLSD